MSEIITADVHCFSENALPYNIYERLRGTNTTLCR